jgi:hypothetical protein
MHILNWNSASYCIYDAAKLPTAKWERKKKGK